MGSSGQERWAGMFLLGRLFTKIKKTKKSNKCPTADSEYRIQTWNGQFKYSWSHLAAKCKRRPSGGASKSLEGTQLSPAHNGIPDKKEMLAGWIVGCIVGWIVVNMGLESSFLYKWLVNNPTVHTDVQMFSFFLHIWFHLLSMLCIWFADAYPILFFLFYSILFYSMKNTVYFCLLQVVQGQSPAVSPSVCVCLSVCLSFRPSLSSVCTLGNVDNKVKVTPLLTPQSLATNPHIFFLCKISLW